MNEELREEHWQRITDEKARRVYDLLCAACEKREGGMTDADQLLVADVAYAEQVKQLLMDDILARGLGQERWNGRQKYWQENKSPAQLRAYQDQQRKHLAELRLTPGGRKAAAVPIEDDFDAFPD
ncbi:MAG: hypothetical protein IKP10_05710 [Clostridia bacterium]|nr:hypothetical protein [Clostridia bacterium]